VPGLGKKNISRGFWISVSKSEEGKGRLAEGERRILGSTKRTGKGWITVT